LRRALIFLLFLLPASLALLSCGGGTGSAGGSQTSGIKYRAFLTNSVSANTGAAGVYIVNAQTDVRALVPPISTGNTPGLMALTPNRSQTLVFSGFGTPFPDNQFSIINNSTEAVSAHATLPGYTESFVVSPDSTTAYIAIPAASVAGQSSGVVDIANLGAGTLAAEIYCPAYNPTVTNPVCLPYPVPQPPPSVCDATPYLCGGFNPPYHFLSMGNTGTRLLAFSEGSDAVANAVAVITPSNAGTTNPVITFASGSGPTAFDHPIWAVFNSNDTLAYVLNCGAECGGTQASIQTLDLTTTPPTPGVPVPVPAATVALVNNSTLYLAGTPTPAQPCPSGTLATNCGLLTIFDLSSMSVVQPPNCAAGQQCPIVITDGYHTRMALGSNGQLFIGARTCTEIIPPLSPPQGAETRGCLSIYNTLPTAVGSIQPYSVGIPPENGDVTGIQPIATRNVVYVVQGQNVQGGSLYIYDTTIDALEYNPNDPNNPGQISNLVGDFVDVITPDF
jgi:hypothetical protein